MLQLSNNNKNNTNSSSVAAGCPNCCTLTTCRQFPKTSGQKAQLIFAWYFVHLSSRFAERKAQCPSSSEFSWRPVILTALFSGIAADDLRVKPRHNLLSLLVLCWAFVMPGTWMMAPTRPILQRKTHVALGMENIGALRPQQGRRAAETLTGPELCPGLVASKGWGAGAVGYECKAGGEAEDLHALGHLHENRTWRHPEA